MDIEDVVSYQTFVYVFDETMVKRDPGVFPPLQHERLFLDRKHGEFEPLHLV
jgi:hypothetical protein